MNREQGYQTATHRLRIVIFLTLAELDCRHISLPIECRRRFLSSRGLREELRLNLADHAAIRHACILESARLANFIVLQTNELNCKTTKRILPDK